MATNPIVYFDVAVGERLLGRMEMELFSSIAPRTCENFRSLCTGERGVTANGVPLHYKNVCFHRVISGFMAQCGDFTRGDGTGGESIYGKTFTDENFVMRHDKPGMLSMANSGLNTNGSQFFFTFKALPHLDNRHVVFGRVSKGMDVLSVIERCATDSEDRPKLEVTVVDCGQIEDESPGDRATASAKKQAAAHAQKQKEGAASSSQGKSQRDTEEASDSKEFDTKKNSSVPVVDVEAATKGMTAVQKRLFLLKMKINLGRNANEQEVEHEYRRSKDPNYTTTQAKQEPLEDDRAAVKAGVGNDKERNNLWGARKQDNDTTGGVDLQQTAVQAEQQGVSLAKKNARMKTHDRESSKQDVYYESYNKLTRKLSNSVDKAGTSSSTVASADAGDADKFVYGSASSAAVSSSGLQRLDKHMQEREEAMAKSKLKRRKIDTDTGVSINAKNEKFNKASKNAFDKYTLEIRQSLERGTGV